jgi:hypothetical protein
MWLGSVRNIGFKGAALKMLWVGLPGALVAHTIHYKGCGLDGYDC